LKYATTIILWLSLIVTEIHSLVENTVATFNGMTLQWYLWLSGNEAAAVFIAAALYFYKENKINRTSVKAYFLFCITDMVMFFVNYKQDGYEAIYTLLLIFWILIYNHGSGRTTNRQGVTTTIEW